MRRRRAGRRTREPEGQAGTAGDPPRDHLPSRRFGHRKGGGVARAQRGGQVHADPDAARVSPAQRRTRPYPGHGLPAQHGRGPVENRLHAGERLVRRGDDGGDLPAPDGRAVGPPAEGGARESARGPVPRGARGVALPGAADLLVRDEADGQARPGDRPRAGAGRAGRTDQRARSCRAPADAQARRRDEGGAGDERARLLPPAARHRAGVRRGRDPEGRRDRAPLQPRRRAAVEQALRRARGDRRRSEPADGAAGDRRRGRVRRRRALAYRPAGGGRGRSHLGARGAAEPAGEKAHAPPGHVGGDLPESHGPPGAHARASARLSQRSAPKRMRHGR